MREKINECIQNLRKLEEQGLKLGPGERAAYASGYLQDYPALEKLLLYIAEMEG